MAHGKKHDPENRLDAVIQDFRDRAVPRSPGVFDGMDADDAKEVSEFLLELKVTRHEMARCSAMVRAVAGVRFSRGECADAMADALRREGFKVEMRQGLSDPQKGNVHAEFWVDIKAFSAP